MTILLIFILWVIFNGRLTTEITIFGLLLSFALAYFVRRFVSPELTPKKQWEAARKIPSFLRYVWLLVVEIALANLAVLKLILVDKYVIEPKLATFHTQLKTRAARVILADCITLTPGTITVSLEEDEYLIHCLDASFENGVHNSEFEKRLLRLEGSVQEEVAP